MTVPASTAPPLVRFTADRRPESATIVSLEGFDGPLGLLLALIEAQKLDVLSVRLGDLAGAYLEALARLPGERLAHLSTFVAVAAQLILIKSRALLPSPPVVAEGEEEPPDPEAELRERLILYRLYRDAGARLSQRLEAGHPLVHREASVAAAAGLANARPAPGPPLDPAILVAALSAATALAPEPPAPVEIVARTITLTERAAAIRAALAGASAFVLQDLLAGVMDRVVVAITFLALLELVKRREVVAEQDEPWGPIRCRRLTAEERTAAGLDGLGPRDEAPIDESLEDFA
ncbi:MAG TPA: ScpA family protein [Candidatus Limnocylindrales bacterium]|nr:ScpA family protein [Candidatus Limnocylindrales bacterium]